MGESDRYQEYKIKKQRFSLGQGTSSLMWLFILNAVIFLILQTIKVSFSANQQDSLFYTEVLQWFRLPASLPRLGERPWTLLSYMFSDMELIRALSNMIWLWAFGSIMQNISGDRKIIPVYIYGGLTGALFFIAGSHLIPASNATIASASVMGANTSVMAVAVAVTMLTPDHRFFKALGGGIPIWLLTIAYIAVDLAGVAGKDPAVAVSHIGGALAGLIFVLLLRKGLDGSSWMNKLYDWFINLFNPEKTKKKYSAKERIFYKTGSRSPYSKTSNVTQQRVDEILDKINQKGYHFLTEEEKSILRRASEE